MTRMNRSSRHLAGSAIMATSHSTGSRPDTLSNPNARAPVTPPRGLAREGVERLGAAPALDGDGAKGFELRPR